MPLFTEKEPENVVQEIPESINVPETLMDSGIKKVETDFTANVKDVSGNPIIQTQQNMATAIIVPANENTLLAWSKGKIESAATWLGKFWLRMIKKAVHFGKPVVVKN